jgi:type 1 glutamine amidotransferase
MANSELKPGQRVRVVQEIDRREGNWQHEVVGKVVWARPEPTGSWFAHGKNDKLWLGRVRLEKEDGELTTIVVDQHTRLELLDDGSTPA